MSDEQLASKAQLAGRLKAACVLRGNFILRSGARSDWYFDKYRIAAHPDLLRDVADMLYERVREQYRPSEPEAVAAPELGAIALGATLAVRSGWPLIQVRKAAKHYGNLTNSPLEGVYFAGQRVVLIEDVVTTGGAVLQAAMALIDAGLVVYEVYCVLDRSGGQAEKNLQEGLHKSYFKLHPLLTTEDLFPAAVPDA